MEISNLTFIVTDDCNFNCSYCLQKKEKNTIHNETIRSAVDFFYPFLKCKNNIHIGFYGGEPLLAFDKIKYTVLLLEEKNKTGNKYLEFHVTTNGSLLSDDMLDFFEQRRFSLLLSFDGLAQDDGRKNGSLEPTLNTMKRFQDHPGISFEINSVFTPHTAGDFFDSIRFLIDHNSPDITFNFDSTIEWNSSSLEILEKELKRLSRFLSVYYKKTNHIPVKNFRPLTPNRDIFRCSAGIDHMAITPEGKLWGCFLFHDYFKSRQSDPQFHDYSFGDLSDFSSNYETLYPSILHNYSDLRQDFFQAPDKDCFLCPNLDECATCPIIAAYSTHSLGKIPCSKCALLKIEKNTKNLFIKRFLDLQKFLLN